ncbi:hypothetical protein [Actinoplanes sp. L3-i22]|uniref:hypothetical protein n=1 Tax=Actinoplanes sp. L3-i22 TaxID=2836373 RepID=UPI001C793F67|nr:hypothetical protein [Actinoplanes sp. L3-i22]BCY07313.1 hypothetical protein L3i22_024010 [Actinoplanes sp. L3-i22]
MTTVANTPGQDQRDPAHRAGVIKAALKTGGGSAAGVAGILAAAAFGAVSTPLAIVAVVVFGVIMVGALVVAARG